jgi:hypothetical protein
VFHRKADFKELPVMLKVCRNTNRMISSFRLPEIEAYCDVHAEKQLLQEGLLLIIPKHSPLFDRLSTFGQLVSDFRGQSVHKPSKTTFL